MDAAGSLAGLTASLDPLEEALAPLLDRPLNETLDSLAPVQQARLLVMLGYLTHDLSWSQSRFSTEGLALTDPIQQSI